MDLQDRLAEELRSRGIEARSPGTWQPPFDLAYETSGAWFVVEVKTGRPVSPQQVRLGVGQVLEYCHLYVARVRFHPVLLVEGESPQPWIELSEALGVKILRADDLAASMFGIDAQPSSG